MTNMVKWPMLLCWGLFFAVWFFGSYFFAEDKRSAIAAETTGVVVLANEGIADEGAAEDGVAEEGASMGGGASMETSGEEPPSETGGDEAVGQETGGDPEELRECSIPLPFFGYEEPRFTSEKKGLFEPQEVVPLLEGEDGWIYIDTFQGPMWAYKQGDIYELASEANIYDSKGAGDPVGNISPQLINVMETDGDWVLADTWLGGKWLNVKEDPPTLEPAEPGAGGLVRLSVPVYNQRSLGYRSGCEIVSTAMMINYAAKADVSSLVSGMPRSDDPYKGFRGDISTVRSGFTIFPPALLSLTREYLGSALDMSGCDMDALKSKLGEGAPIVAWVNGLGFNVHAICLTGYDEKGFFYNDPWTASSSHITYSRFYAVWDKAIYDSHTGEYYSTRKALSYMP